MLGLASRFLFFLLLNIALVAVPAEGGVISRRDVDDGGSDTTNQGADNLDSDITPGPGDCKEVQYPCTRVYSVQKPVKQCISNLCVTSVRRVYMVNKEICTRLMCKEDEVLQDEKCRQQAGLPPRRFPQPETPEEKPTPDTADN
ncbi:microfibrillar-associated protein 5 [Ascaphus truei]|uniref:microfibrillar-associated protein 5 n=1 Tax=Ascaphus truei TaxID=8439 RepID=UPI003F5A47B8